MKEVKLSSCVVEIKDSITWGDQEAIRAAILSGTKLSVDKIASGNVEFTADAMLAAKYKAIERLVVKVITDGKETAFSKEWMENLTPEDGDKLSAAVDEVSNPAKK